MLSVLSLLIRPILNELAYDKLPRELKKKGQSSAREIINAIDCHTDGHCLLCHLQAVLTLPPTHFLPSPLRPWHQCLNTIIPRASAWECAVYQHSTSQFFFVVSISPIISLVLFIPIGLSPHWTVCSTRAGTVSALFISISTPSISGLGDGWMYG